MGTVQEQFNTEEKTLAVLRDARYYFSTNKTTMNDYSMILRTLGFCLLHCPQKMASMVEATIEEAVQRQMYARAK